MKLQKHSIKFASFVFLLFLLTPSTPLTCGTTARENCEECEDQNGADKEKCKHCEFGYYPERNPSSEDLGSCVQCFNGCEYCVNPDICTKCKKGFFMYEASIGAPPNLLDKTTCIICTDNCAKCNDATDCQQCADGYAIITEGCPKIKEPDNKKDKKAGEIEAESCCKLCAKNCKVCASSTSCETCKPGYFIHQVTKTDGSTVNECVACSDYDRGIVGCDRCDTGKKCTRCKPEYYLKNETFCAEVVEYCKGAGPAEVIVAGGFVPALGVLGLVLIWALE